MTSRRELLTAAAALAVRPAFGQSAELPFLTLKQASDQLRSRRITSVDLTEACLERVQKYDSKLHSFITVTADRARATARERDSERQRGHWRGPLHGVPIALKDNIDTAEIRTTGASELFKDRVPTEDAEVARRLRNAGAVLLGKQNLVEFAYGGNPTDTYFGTVHNPWNLDRTPGGSSSGPGAATAAGFCFGTLGTDTAGSIRNPAANCGIVGLKPTYGRVSMRGILPLSWTLDHAGPICRSVEDAAILLQVIAGYDPEDPTTADVPVPDYTRALKMPTAKLRLARPAGFFDHLDPEVEKAANAAIEVLRNLTGGMTDVKLPPYGNPALVWGPEALAYHSKWFAESPEKYQPPTRRQLEQSTMEKAADYAQAVRNVHLARREVRKAFANVDLLICPTTAIPPALIASPPAPTTGPRRGQGGAFNLDAPFDVFGLPAISVPCGFTADGLPLGLQIIGAPFAEPTVLALAHAYEQATEWHLRHPELAA